MLSELTAFAEPRDRTRLSRSCAVRFNSVEVDGQLVNERFDPIRSNFPEYREIIDCLLIFDEDFREICRDYEDILRAMRVPEMRQLLCRELEDEMLSRLNRFTTAGRRVREEVSITVS